MTPAAWPLDDPAATRLLHVDAARGGFADHRIGALVALVAPGDLVVVNDAATLPGSLRGLAEGGAAIEARLAGPLVGGRAPAVLFGGGDWRARTEDRPPPPHLAVGDTLRFGELTARIVAVDGAAPRLVELQFAAADDELYPALYRLGRPVQYSYVARPVALWDVQTAYASRPWAAEAPSAGLPLTWALLLAIARRGVALARVTHAAGLSSTGDPALDARLPLAERYAIPAETVRAIARTRARGGRVLAVGTTVTRALEGAAAAPGGLVAGESVTSLRLGPATPRRVVDGILTGVHDAGDSHFTLLEAFAPRALLLEAHAFAAARGYRGHEFGDVALVWARR